VGGRQAGDSAILPALHSSVDTSREVEKAAQRQAAAPTAPPAVPPSVTSPCAMGLYWLSLTCSRRQDGQGQAGDGSAVQYSPGRTKKGRANQRQATSPVLPQ
jgi:hypothetical protein